MQAAEPPDQTHLGKPTDWRRNLLVEGTLCASIDLSLVCDQEGTERCRGTYSITKLEKRAQHSKCWRAPPFEVVHITLGFDRARVSD